MNVRLTTVLGVVLGLVGLAAVAVPELTTGLPTGDFVVQVLGALLVLGGLREVQRRRRTPGSYAETPDTEQAVELPTPGADFDDRLARFTGRRYRISERERLRDTLAEVTRETLQRRLDYTEADAEAAMRAGTWTDDRYAAAAFASKGMAVSRTEQIRELVNPGSSFRRRTRHVVDELYRLATGEEVDRDE